VAATALETLLDMLLLLVVVLVVAVVVHSLVEPLVQQVKAILAAHTMELEIMAVAEAVLVLLAQYQL
jgi:hypothetical protein